MTARLNRYVVGPDAEGRSAVLDDALGDVQSKEGFFWRSTLWATQEMPVDNTIEGDRSLAPGARREPFPQGMLCRALEIPPDAKDADDHRQVFAALNEQAQQTHTPSAADSQRHPTMHRTDTLDCITCVKGEIYLITDVEEVLMRPGDTVIIRGTNHGWSNRSDAPCLLVGTMMDARPGA
ncbi:cupin domain-containing protein [Streptomyces sp. A5-4]|uniref:cupin domain-containing protein n=1 Tax=Streptomyces sp. A5-4 TaxID=3384771 RepID=UPI003DA7EB7E